MPLTSTQARVYLAAPGAGLGAKRLVTTWLPECPCGLNATDVGARDVLRRGTAAEREGELELMAE